MQTIETYFADGVYIYISSFMGFTCTNPVSKRFKIKYHTGNWFFMRVFYVKRCVKMHLFISHWIFNVDYSNLNWIWGLLIPINFKRLFMNKWHRNSKNLDCFLSRGLLNINWVHYDMMLMKFAVKLGPLWISITLQVFI